MPALALFALVGVLTGLWLPASGSLISVWTVCLAGPLICWFAGAKLVVAMLGFVCAGMACQAYQAKILHPELAGKDIVLTGVVSDFPRATTRGLGLQFDVRTDDASGRLPTRVALRIFGDTPRPQVGELWQLKVRLKPPFGFVNPGGYDRSLKYLAKNIHATGYVRSSVINQRLAAISLNQGALALRAKLRGRLESLLGESEMLPLLLGLTVGARDRITTAHWDLFRSTGTSHLMAISGLHIGMIALSMWFLGLLPAWLAGMVGITLNSRRLAGWLAATGALLYALLAGFTLPTMRALTMLLLVFILSSQHRYVSRPAILAFALLMAVLTNPVAVLLPGFWLSFAAVTLLFLCIAQQPSGEQAVFSLRLYLLQRTQQALRAQWVLGWGLALPACLFFGQVSLIAPLANLIAVPVFTFFILPAALAGSVLTLLTLPVATEVLQVAISGLSGLVKFLELLQHSPLSTWEIGRLSPAFLVATSVGALLLLLPRPFTAPYAGMTFIALGIALNQPERNAGVSVRILDVGQGLAVLVQTPDHNLLYDAGPAWLGGDVGQSVIIPALQRLGIKKLDALVISHADNDHSGGAASVVGVMDVIDIYGPPDLRVAQRNATTCESGMRWQWNEARFEIVHPRTHAGWSGNNASCVLQVSIGDHNLLLVGDIEAAAEAVLLARGDLLPADLVIAPHHGSKSSSTPALVDALSATYVIYAVGFMNRWGFPSPEVRQRWESSGACGLAIPATGALEFKFVPGRGFLLTDLAAASWLRPWAIRQPHTPACIQAVATVKGTSSGL
jgi:competence protein ComEC